jgi:hypothetical protein
MTEYYKYPRTYHLPWSLGCTNDDKIIKDLSPFKDMYGVVTEKMDGENCLSPDTIINTEDGNKSIKEICESKYLGKSLSMDIDTNEIEFQNIVNHSIIDHDVKDDWFEIELENGVKIEITGNHYVFLPKLNCYRKVSELKTDDDVIFLQ